jgi:hypothetical protein
MNVQVQTDRAITALLVKKVVIFSEICLCDEQLLTAQMVQKGVNSKAFDDGSLFHT